MQVCRASQVYNPHRTKMPFVLHFDTDSTVEQESLALKAIAHLSNMGRAQLIQESEEFFKYIVMFHVSPTFLHYAERLLRFFQSQGLLTFKQSINTVTKQQKQRYLVMFNLNGKVVTQTYNSIRELKADTGKRPCQIKPGLTLDMLQPKNT